MDELFLTLGVVLLVLLGGWVSGIAGFARANAAQRDIAALRAEVARLRAELGGMAGAMIAAGFRPPAPVPAPEPLAAPPPWAGTAPPPQPTPERQATPEGRAAPEALAAPAVAEAPPDAAPGADRGPAPAAAPPWGPAAPDRPRQSLEEVITQRWGVWLGAGALMLAAVFLIRFAVEEGWLGPAARSAGAAILGLALVIGGEWLARRAPPAAAAPPAGGAPEETGAPAAAAPPPVGALPDQAPAALAGGGVAALFGAAFAATVLYGLLPPLIGFAAMAAAGVFGLVLSLRRGPLVAAVGLAGAFASPALVGSSDPSIPGLFAYLLVVTVAAMLVVRATAWGWLGWAAMTAGTAWLLLASLAAEGLDQWALAVFAAGAAASFLFLLPREALGTALGRRLSHLPPLVPAAALLPLAATDPALAPVAGALMLSPVAILAARRDDRLSRLPGLAAGLGLLALLVWAVPNWLPTAEPITVEGAVQAIIPGAWVPEALGLFLAACLVFAALHLAAGMALEARAGAAWAGLAAGVPVLTLLVAYARVRGFAADPSWALAAAALAAVHVAAAARGMRASDPARAGLHAAGATAALALGVAMVLRDQWLTLAVAIFLPPLAMIARRFGLDPLRRVAGAVAAVVLVRLALNRFVLGYDWGALPLLNLLLAYGVPAACFWWAARIFLAQRDGRLVRLLEAGGALFATLLALLGIRQLVQDGMLAASRWGFLEAALQASALFGCAWAALLAHRRGGRIAMLWAARAAGAAGLVLGVVLLANNPWTANEPIPGLPLLNALLPAYALPALLAAVAVARAPEARVPRGLGTLLSAYALAAAFAWVTLEVRRAFHAAAMGPARITEAEMYAYSGAWLLLGALLLAIGIRSGRKEIRLAALGVIALTTLKVFLFDMGALVGLWRVLSFLGLGLALIALGAIYRRFVVTPGAPGRGTAPAPPAAAATPAGGAAPPA